MIRLAKLYISSKTLRSRYGLVPPGTKFAVLHGQSIEYCADLNHATRVASIIADYDATIVQIIYSSFAPRNGRLDQLGQIQPGARISQ